MFPQHGKLPGSFLPIIQILLLLAPEILSSFPKQIVIYACAEFSRDSHCGFLFGSLSSGLLLGTLTCEW